jgi:broad specificity phosphatase PhoE
VQTIVLVRHGYPTTWDEPPKPRGTPPHLKLDPGLAVIGQEQARSTATHLATCGAVAAVISSPFRRCLETADLIASACQAAVTPDWRVGEVLLSQVLGSPFSLGSSMDPAWEERRDGAGKPAHPESDQTIKARVMNLTLALRSRKPHAQRLVIVGHEIILKELYKAMTGRPLTLDWHPAAITTLTRATAVDRNWRLVGKAGDFAHLGAHDRCEPVQQISHTYHPLDSRS